VATQYITIVAKAGQILRLDNGNYIIDASAGNVTVIAGNGNDTVIGGAGDIITLGNGNDTVLGGSGETITLGNGADTVSVGAGSTIIAGNGNDVLTAGANSTITAGNGTDTISAGPGSAISAGQAAGLLSTPTIAGTAREGQTLTAAASSAHPITYAWYSSADNYTNAIGTGASYQLKEADEGFTLEVKATVVLGNGHGPVITETSAATAAVLDALPTITTPTVSGTAREGKTLTASASSGQSDNPVTFAWYSSADSYANPIGTGATYQLKEGDEGFTIAVKATATNDNGATASAMSAATDAVLDALPTITTPTIAMTATGGGPIGFAAPLAVPTSSDTGGIVVDTVNGKPEIVASDFPFGGAISVLTGDGAGNFSAPTNYATGGISPNVLILGDFNNDAIEDVAVLNQDFGGASVLLGNPDGSFQSPIHLNSSSPNPNALATADFNHDGKLDLVLGQSTGEQLLYYQGNGNGTFQNPVVLESGYQVAGLAVGDVAGTGNPDIFAAAELGNNTSQTDILEFVNNGNGTFSGPQVIATLPGSMGSLALADLQGNGVLDLIDVEVNAPTGGILVMIGDGHGGFGAPTTYGTVKGQNNPDAMAVADFNGDGKLDVAVLNESKSVAIFQGNGDGTFGPEMDISLPGSESIAAADVNGDGRPDLVVSNNAGHIINVLTSQAATAAGPREGQILTASATAGQADNHVTFAWYSSADGYANPIGTGATYQVKEGDEGFTIEVKATATNDNGATASAISAATAAVLDAAPTITTPTITGMAQEGQPLTASASSGQSDNPVTFAWYSSHDGYISPIGTGATYVLQPADDGFQIEVRATATNDNGATASATSAPTAAVTAATPNVSLSVAVSVAGNGAVQEGQLLIASASVTGDPGPGATIAYQWQSSNDGGHTWNNIAATTTAVLNGVPSSFYQLSEADERNKFRAVASLTEGVQVVTATSAATAAAGDVAPAIMGGFRYAVDEFKVLEADASFNISTPFDDTFTQGPPPVASLFASTPTAFSTGGSTWSEANGKAILSASGAVANPTNTADIVSATLLTNTQPEGTGPGQSESGLKEDQIFRVGATFDLIAPPPGGGGYGIQLNNGVPGQPASEQLFLEVEQTSAGVTVALIQQNPSAGTSTVLAAQALTPAQLAGNTQIELDLTHITPNSSAVTGSFQLFDNGSPTGDFAFDPTGHAFDNQTFTRASLIAVAPKVAMTGIPQEGQTLTANAVTNDADATLHYQWQSSANGGQTWTPIAGAGDSASYRLQETDESHTIRVAVSTTDADNNVTSSVTSLASPPISDAPPSLSVSVSGLAREGATLTATPTITSDADDGSVSYQWQSSTDGGHTWGNITGAGGQTYTPQENDEGAALRVQASFTNDSGQTATAMSGATAQVADAPISISGLPSSLSVADDTTVTIPFTATGDGDDAAIIVSGLPAGVTLNGAIDNHNGTWTLGLGNETLSLSVGEETSGTITFANAEDGSVIQTLTLTVTPAAEPPIVAAPTALDLDAGASTSLVINPLPTDTDDTIDSVTISGLPSDVILTDAANDILTIVNGSITLTPAQLTGLTLQAGTTSATLQVTAQASEGGTTATSAPQSIALNVTISGGFIGFHPDRAPVNFVPPPLSTDENVPLALPIQVADPDNDILTTTITGAGSEGAFDLPGMAGAPSLTLTGTADQINQALEGLTVTFHDQLNQEVFVTTSDGTYSTIDSIPISYAAPAPTISAPDSQFSANEHVVFSSATGNAITVTADDDHPLFLLIGTTNLQQPFTLAGQDFSPIPGDLVFDGTTAQINAMLADGLSLDLERGPTVLNIRVGDGQVGSTKSIFLDVYAPVSPDIATTELNDLGGFGEGPSAEANEGPYVLHGFTASFMQAVLGSATEGVVTISAAHGSLDDESLFGSINVPTNDPHRLVLQGSAPALTEGFLTYIPDPGFVGFDVIEVSGPAGNFAMPVFDGDYAPASISAPTDVTTHGSQAFVFGPASDSLIDISDPALALDTTNSMSLTVTLRVAEGTLELAPGSSVNVIAETGTNGIGGFPPGPSSITFTGSLAQIDSALAGLVYQPPQLDTDLATGVNPYTSLLIDVSDGITTRSAGVNIHLDDAAPQILVPGQQSIVLGSDLVFDGLNGNALKVADGDADVLSVSMSVLSGTLQLASGASGFALSLTGTPEQINSALDGLTYIPGLPGAVGQDFLQISASDAFFTVHNSVALSVEPAVVDAGETVGITGPYGRDITFAASTGTLQLSDSQDYSGHISGFGGQDHIDLGDIAFGQNTTLLYTPNADNSGGTLTVSDGAHKANIAMLGEYVQASFAMSGGPGVRNDEVGTLISDTGIRPQNQLAASH
jgi:hypothetical protein